MDKTVKPKSRLELDTMTKEQIENHRVAYCSQSVVSEKEARRYFEELDLYKKIRFKDDVFAQYERWAQEAANPDSIDPQYRESSIFTSGIIEKVGRENFYKLVIDQIKKDLGEMQYIT